MAEIPDRLVDKRIVERNIRKGLIHRKDYEKFLKELHDAGDNAELVHVGGDADEGDESEE